MNDKQIISLICILSIIASNLLPVFSPRVEAQFFSPFVFDVPHTTATVAESTRKTVKDVLDIAARIAAQLVLERLVASTVKWANTGFEGNPAYVTDPEQYFSDLADGIAGDFIQNNKQLGFLCSPFQAQIKLSLMQEYYEPEPFQCTLTDVVENIESFYGDFSQGGWDAWFSMTQNPTNNPYGAYLKARMELDSRVASALNIENKRLEWNQGYLSWATCEKWEQLPESDGSDNTDKNKNGLTCIKRGPTRTPGGHIKAQLDKVIPSGLEKLIRVEHIEQLVEAFAVGLLKRYVFGSKGLFSNDASDWKSEGGGSTTPGIPGGQRFIQVDIDGDGIFDGMDTNGDGQLDTCFFGGTTTPQGPPCLGSKQAVKTPGSGGGGGSCTPPTAWGWDDRGGPAFQSSKCPSIDPKAYFEGLVAGKSISNFKQVLDQIEPQLWACGIGQQRNSAQEPRGRLFLPHASCPDAAENPKFGSSQNPACWEHAVDVAVGSICTPDGGGTTPPPVTPPPGTPGGPTLTSVSPTSAQSGVTTITLSGTNLTSTVQFFDASGARTTVVGSVNSAGTQTTVLVPAGLTAGSYTVRIYKDASTYSSALSLQISGGGGGGGGDTATVPSYSATSGWGGAVAFNSQANNWLVVSARGNPNGIMGRIMGNDGAPVTNEFKINDTELQAMAPKVAYAPDSNVYLVAWITWTGSPDKNAAKLYGRFVKADGSLSGQPFLIYEDQAGNISGINAKSLMQYDASNKKFVFAWDHFDGSADISMIAVSPAGTVGALIDAGGDAGGGSMSPALAINESTNEYCLVYDKRNSGATVTATRRIDAVTGTVGPENTINNGGQAPSIAYNSATKQYLVSWNAGPTVGTQGKFLNSCNITNGGSIFTVNSAGGSATLSYNPKSNTFASIVQNQNDAGNTYKIMSATGSLLTTGVAFGGGFGNFVPVIASNTSDGTFAAISSREYSLTRFAPNLKK